MLAFPGRLRRLQQVGRRDPVRDHHAVYQNVALWDFPTDTRTGLLLAFWRSFTIPRIAEILLATGEMTRRTRKRADDTGILMYELIIHGFEHPRGRQAVRRLNRIHHGLPVGNAEHLYVLATLAVIPTRWIDRNGWRPLCCHERTATHAFYRELGRRLAIRDIPDTYDRLAAWLDDYERVHMRYSAAGARLMTATKGLFADLPRWLAPGAARVVDALLDPDMRAATGTSAPPRYVAIGLRTALAARRRLQRLAPARPSRHLADGISTHTYPHGYDLDRVGPRRTADGGT